METPGADEPSPIAEPTPPLPSPAAAPRPAAGPTTSGIPVEPATPHDAAATTEPITVGDPVGGTTVTAAITAAPSVPSSRPPVLPAGGGMSGGGMSGGGSSGGGAGGGDGTGPSGGLNGDWPAQATDAIVNVVGAVRDRTTGPILKVARGLVFGLLVVVLGSAVFVMAIIAVIRLLDEALPSGVWLPYLILGALFVLGGALVFRKRNQPAPQSVPTGNTGRH